MVARKPVQPLLSTSSQQQDASNVTNAVLPYPTTPTLDSAEPNTSSTNVYSPDPATTAAFDLIDLKDGQQRPRSDSDASHGTWDSDDADHDASEHEEDVPEPLRIAAGKRSAEREGEKEDVPAILRPGPMNGGPVRRPQESQKDDEEAQVNPWAGQAGASTVGTTPQSPRLESNNPYRRHNSFEPANSQAAWQEVKPPPPPANPPPPPPVELPTIRSPVEVLSDMSLDDRPPEWTPSFETAEVLPVPPLGQPPLAPVTGSAQRLPQSPPSYNQTQQERRNTDYSPPPGPPPKAPLSPAEMQYTHSPGIPPTSSGSMAHHAEPTRSNPVRIDTDQSGPSTVTDSVPETPRTQARTQRNEHYQIKHVNWFDASSNSGPQVKPAMRQSPILTQNANGPCPLLALVNALVLSTPQNTHTALLDTLSAREQVSLGLLLDAVFDELTSGRRGDTAHELPDVSELYTFLLALHTGMNVNPRFVAPATAPRGSLGGQPSNPDRAHPQNHAQSTAGCFEETKEMKLYSTFNIPLIHGWTVSRNSPEYVAFERSAQTFEDAQNIQFAESELEDKLRSEGLGAGEQQKLQDIQTIKQFLNTWPTQLTENGLEAISKSLQLGQIAILFRNDHFSTIYKEPKHGALMTLVTDSGYSTHAEIVWESLVDVNGAASELFSGDFRVVSHNSDARVGQDSWVGREDRGQDVPSRQRYHGQRLQFNAESSRTANGAFATEGTPPPLPGPRPSTGQLQAMPSGEALGVQAHVQRKTTEQEDHDLALALQLQEEEEDQHRQDEERRRRELELSEQFLSTEGEGPRPTIPPRRSGSSQAQLNSRPATTFRPPSGRPAVSRPSDASDDPDAPPSYEQAASDRPYRPAGATAPNLQGNPLNAYDALRRQQSAYTQQSSTSVNTAGLPSGHGRRRSDANRLRRRSSQLVVPGASLGPAAPAYSVPGGPSAQQQAGRVNMAPGIRDTDERCLVM